MENKIYNKLDKLFKKCTKEDLIDLLKSKITDNTDKYIDVKNMFVCKYTVFGENSEKYGLFRKKIEKKDYETIETFTGIDQNNIGTIILLSLQKLYNLASTNSKISIDKKIYNDTCKIDDSINFNEIRAKMYQYKNATFARIGNTTENEMKEVLKFATENYFAGKKKIKK